MRNFKIGEKVVCIDGKPKDERLIKIYNYKYPKENEIYTIRQIFIASTGELTFYLNEIKNIQVTTVVGVKEVGFTAKRFRKLDHQFGEDVCAEILKKVKQESLISVN